MRFEVSTLPVGRVWSDVGYGPMVFDEHQAKSDGNCLFHSLCFLFYSHGWRLPYQPDVLRGDVVAHIRSRYFIDRYTRPWGFDQRYESAEAYFTALAKDQEWGDANCIRAVAEMYRLLIVVHHDFGFPEVCAPWGHHTPFVLNLVYRGNNHYNPLLPSQGRKKEPKKLPSRRGSRSKWAPKEESRSVPVRLQRSNSLDVARCACKVTPMKSDAVEVPTYAPNGELVEMEKRYYCVYSHLTEQPFFYVLANDLRPERRRSLLEKPFLDGHLDWYASSSLKKGKLIGATNPYFHNLFKLEEACYYAGRALFDTGCAGVAGRMRVLSVPSGTEADLLPGSSGLKVRVQVYDGFGYIKRCLAQKLEGTLIAEKISVDPPKANYQMFQWLVAEDEEDRELEQFVAEELAGGGRPSGKKEKHSSKKLEEPEPEGEYRDERWVRSLLALDPELAHHPLFVEMRYRARLDRLAVRMTTGDPPLASGVAMPVATPDVVLPVTERLDDFQRGPIGVFRYPGDTLNWVCTDEVDDSSDMARFLGTMESVQYTLTGRKFDIPSMKGEPEEGPGLLTFYKGMFGVIEDDMWPDEWADFAIVVGHDDQKANEAWTEEGHVLESRARKGPEAFELDGCLVLLNWFEAGSCIGLSYEGVQKKLAGDYDGDLAVLLSGTRFPTTYRYIGKKLKESGRGVKNPKLPKLYSPKVVGESRSNCILKVWDGASLAGAWSNIAAILLAFDAKTRDELAEIVSQAAKEQGKEDQVYPSGAHLLARASLGYKEGTDAFKTKVDIQQSFSAAKVIRDVLRSRGLSVPYIHMKRDELLFTDDMYMPVVQREMDSLREDPWAKKFTLRLDHQGIPARLMRMTMEGLRGPTREEARPLADFLGYVDPPVEEDQVHVEAIGALAKDVILRVSPSERVAFQKEWKTEIGRYGSEHAIDRDKLARLAWCALHDAKNLPDQWAEWKLAAGAFWEFREEVRKIIEAKAKKKPPPKEPEDGDDIESLVDEDFFDDLSDDFHDDDLV